MAQLVKCPALDLGSGHYARIVALNSVLGSVMSVEPAWDSRSLSLSLSFSLSAPSPLQFFKNQPIDILCHNNINDNSVLVPGKYGSKVPDLHSLRTL